MSASNKTRVTELRRARAARIIAVRSHSVSPWSNGSFATMSHNRSNDEPFEQIARGKERGKQLISHIYRITQQMNKTKEKNHKHTVTVDGWDFQN